MFGFKAFFRGAARMGQFKAPVQTPNRYMISCSQKQVTNMIAISLPVPTLGIMNLMNLREMIERCKEEAELDTVLIQGTTFMLIGMNPPQSSLVRPIFLSAFNQQQQQIPCSEVLINLFLSIVANNRPQHQLFEPYCAKLYHSKPMI